MKKAIVIAGTIPLSTKERIERTYSDVDIISMEEAKQKGIIEDEMKVEAVDIPIDHMENLGYIYQEKKTSYQPWKRRNKNVKGGRKYV